MIFGPAEETSTIRINGQIGIGLGILRQAQSNTLDISNGVRAAVAEINRSGDRGLREPLPHQPRHVRRGRVLRGVGALLLLPERTHPDG